ncbi:ATP-binding protein [Streptomyces sp. NPDC005931]|uniref:ATP-binding protein n=1 Tax=Streptomyces sp. NPDC005931 TaxID=3364737 RepID=UPI0036C55D20
MAKTTELDLDPLTRWCGDVLNRGLDGAPGCSADTAPPMPDHLAAPLLRHGFDAFDLTAVALTLAPDLDPVLATALSALTGASGPRRPTLSVIADLVGATGPGRAAVAARLCPCGPLAQVGLVHVAPPVDHAVVSEPPWGPSMQSTLVASTALLRWTFGVTRLEPSAYPAVRDDLGAPGTPADPSAAEIVAERLRTPGPTLTVLSGRRAADALGLALHAAARCRRPALTVEAAALVAFPAAARVAAEALLRDAVVVVIGDTRPVPPARWQTLSTVVVVGPVPVLDDIGRDVVCLDVRSAPGASGGNQLVDQLRGRGVSVAAPEADRMSRWEHLDPQDIGRLATTIAARSRSRADPARIPTVTADDLTAACLGVVGHELASLATPLAGARDWSALVLPEPLRGRLTELVRQAAARSEVLDGLGFAELPGQPRGVTALFAGPSGTGKTLAARLVAGDLGLPLYRVDLSRTVSKYIGETERNLDQVFSAAERSDAVLLFDEAEALFGKRSEVQDARDRYANMEIAFLLQRMESYEGVALLATNLLGHLDDAFARRLSFCLRFPFPDAALRARIWRAVWPRRAVLAADVDLDALAQRHLLSGGHIRNIAVTAAHLAATDGRPIDAECVDRAVEREYEKLGIVPEPRTGAEGR